MLLQRPVCIVRLMAFLPSVVNRPCLRIVTELFRQSRVRRRCYDNPTAAVECWSAGSSTASSRLVQGRLSFHPGSLTSFELDQRQLRLYGADQEQVWGVVAARSSGSPVLVINRRRSLDYYSV